MAAKIAKKSNPSLYFDKIVGYINLFFILYSFACHKKASSFNFNQIDLFFQQSFS